MIVGIIGATGYAGAEIARILSAHPKVDSLALASASFEGRSFASVYPNFLGLIDQTLESADSVIAKSDVVFGALPNGVSAVYAASCIKRGISFIDMSADFRFDTDEAVYKAWYGKGYDEPALHDASIYGLCELNRDKIKALAGNAAKPAPIVVGNPGCYPTCASLAAWPALKEHIAGAGSIIVDAASGITGGGREPQRSFHFPECHDSITPYKVGAHRHTPEIARNFCAMEGVQRHVIFTPHLAPMNRGILATLYIPLAPEYRAGDAELRALSAPYPPEQTVDAAAARLQEIYARFYAKEHFVRVLPAGVYAATNRVRGSNYCDISISLDQSGSMLIVTAAIDNMVKGAAGQAVQNMNIIFNFAEDSGLGHQPLLF